MSTPSDFATATPPTAGHSPRQVVLGLFIVGQLAFLVLYNLIELCQDAQARLHPRTAVVVDRIVPGYSNKSGHAWMIMDEISTPLRRWAQLTGQDQSWSLFAPAVAKVTGFPAVTFVWDEVPTSAHAVARPLGLLAAHHPLEVAALGLSAQETASDVPPAAEELFLSDNEPADRYHFFRVGKFRTRRYETNLILYLRQRKGDEYEKDERAETEAEARARWGGTIREHVNENGVQMLAYLKWRLAAWQQGHRGRPAPRQVILVERSYTILLPNDHTGAVWEGPRTTPLMRWQPRAAWQNGYRPIEWYDPVTQRFETIPK
jgi:hypothetical protein